ncbi:MAG: lipid II flippase MurJ, partial [Candidatus Bipolaricaulaceae bacterium]
PLNLFGLTVSQVIYPLLSLHSAREEREELRTVVSQSLEILWLFLAPASVGLIMLSRDTIAFFFERGAFTPNATVITAEALVFYSIGLLAHGSLEIVARTFYAQKDTRTPVIVGAIGFLTNTLLNWLLVRPLAHKGLALATSVSAVLSCLILLKILRRKLGGLEGRVLVKNLTKIILASGIMGIVLFPMRATASVWWRYLITVVVGAGVYGVCVFALRPRCVVIIWRLSLRMARHWLKNH